MSPVDYAKTPPIADLWLMVASGGWWKARELAEALEADKKPIHANLQRMKRRGNVVQRTIPADKRVRTQSMGATERVEFAVTPERIVPAGLSARQVLDALKGTGSP